MRYYSDTVYSNQPDVSCVLIPSNLLPRESRCGRARKIEDASRSRVPVARTTVVYFHDYASVAVSDSDPRSEGYGVPSRARQQGDGVIALVEDIPVRCPTSLKSIRVSAGLTCCWQRMRSNCVPCPLPLVRGLRLIDQNMPVIDRDPTRFSAVGRIFCIFRAVAGAREFNGSANSWIDVETPVDQRHEVLVDLDIVSRGKVALVCMAKPFKPERLLRVVRLVAPPPQQKAAYGASRGISSSVERAL